MRASAVTLNTTRGPTHLGTTSSLSYNAAVSAVAKVSHALSVQPFNDKKFYKKPGRDIPIFDRTLHDAKDWLILFIAAATATGWDRRDWPVKLTQYLGVEAFNWFIASNAVHLDFDRIGEAMIHHFASPAKEDKLFQQFIHSAQEHGESVASFASRIETIARAIPGQITDDILIKHFIRNTLPDISGSITWATHLPFREVVGIAEQRELALSWRATSNRPSSNSGSISRPRGSSVRTPPVPANVSTHTPVGPSGLFQAPFTSENSSSGRRPPTAPRKDVTCSYCRKYGHEAIDCYSRQRDNAPIPPQENSPSLSVGVQPHH
jgi:hypothetical protein